MSSRAYRAATPRYRHPSRRFDRLAETREALARFVFEELVRLAGIAHVATDAPLPQDTDAEPFRSSTFSLLYLAYDECRRAVDYLRWHDGDAGDFAPSPYRGRGGSKRAVSPSEPIEPISHG